jgi:phosphohistidine phosphatase SixA
MDRGADDDQIRAIVRRGHGVGAPARGARSCPQDCEVVVKAKALSFWRETQRSKHGPVLVGLGILAAVATACAAGPRTQGVALAPEAGPAVAQQAPRILLVRHGETTPDGSRDPELSEAGRQRAEQLARVLGSAGVTRVLSTDYKRTQGTAAPLARAAGLDVESYDPTDLAGLAVRLRSASGVILVVGHSNTTPELVGALGGDPHGTITEHEHDRLYVLVPDGAAGAVATLLLRY